MPGRTSRRLPARPGLPSLASTALASAALAVASLAVFPDAARAQGHGGGGTLALPELLSGVTHGVVQGAAVFLAGLAAFVALVWLPTVRAAGIGGTDPDGDATPGDLAFGMPPTGAWVLFGVIAVVGAVDLGVYAVLGSGEPLGVGLFFEALFTTLVGWVALARLALSFLAALAVAWAARGPRAARWWTAFGVGVALLVTLVPESHAATQGALAMASIWVHLVAAALWMGGLISLPILLLGPVRALEPGARSDLLRRTVRRFSGVATVAVSAVVLTGLYNTLLNVSGPLALVGTPYGRALIMKIGLLVFLLAAGGINLMDKGRGPLGRMVGLELLLAAGIFVAAGFLTSLPQAD